MERPNEWKVRIFGDSIMRGIIYDAKRDQHLPAPRALSFSHNFYSHIKVKNSSTFGATIIKGSNSLQRAIKQGLSSDIVLVEFGGNDCNLRWKEVALHPDSDHNPRTPLPLFDSTLRSMISMIRMQGSIPLLMNLPPIDEKQYLDYLSKDITNIDSIMNYVKERDSMTSQHETYSRLIEMIAQETNTHFVDVRREFLMFDNYTSLLCEDGIHPTVEGYSIIEETLKDYLYKMTTHFSVSMKSFSYDRCMYSSCPISM